MEEMNMKTVYKIFALATAAISIVSCDLNKPAVFEDSKSFVSFDKTSFTVNENAGSVTIPVTIASVDPKKVSVAYRAVDGDAVSGVNFKLKDQASLAFDGNARTMNIEIEIINHPDEYTGDLAFTVELVDAGDVNIGASSKCTVRIADLDHPLASILGTYEADGVENWDGPIKWEVTFDKDAEDATVVWISGLAPGLNLDVYANVSEDLRHIYIPVGQTGPYNSSYNLLLVGFKAGGYYSPEGILELEKTDYGWVMTDPDWGFGALACKVSDGSPAGWLTAVYPEVELRKK